MLETLHSEDQFLNNGNLTLTRVVMSGSSTAQQVKGAVLFILEIVL